MTMGNDSVSIKSVPPIHKTKIKKKKKNQVLGKVLGYLKSDTYLYAPIVSSQRFISPEASTGAMETDPVFQKNKKLVDKLMDFLNSDYHMYAPLVAAEEPSLNADKGLKYPVADMNRVKEVMRKVTDETRVQNHQKKAFSIKSVRLDGYSRGKYAGVNQKVLQKETVKHVVQPKRRFALFGPKAC